MRGTVKIEYNLALSGDKAEAAGTSADDKTSANAIRIGAVTNRDGEEIARRNIVPDVTGTRT